MLVFERKQFALIFCFLLLSFSAYFVSANSIDTQNRSYDIKQVSSLPVTSKVVILDAGHGGEDRTVRLILLD